MRDGPELDRLKAETSAIRVATGRGQDVAFDSWEWAFSGGHDPRTRLGPLTYWTLTPLHNTPLKGVATPLPTPLHHRIGSDPPEG